jgi:hypothetical protein
MYYKTFIATFLLKKYLAPLKEIPISPPIFGKKFAFLSVFFFLEKGSFFQALTYLLEVHVFVDFNKYWHRHNMSILYMSMSIGTYTHIELIKKIYKFLIFTLSRFFKTILPSPLFFSSFFHASLSLMQFIPFNFQNFLLLVRSYRLYYVCNTHNYLI